MHSGYSGVLRFLAANRLVIAPLPQPPLVHPMAGLVIKIWARAPPSPTPSVNVPSTSRRMCVKRRLFTYTVDRTPWGALED